MKKLEKWCDTTLENHRRKFKVHISKKELLKLAKETLYCPLCGCHLNWYYTNHGDMNCPQFDRKDNETKLTLDNIWIVCRRCNIAKGKMPLAKFVGYCELIYKRFNKIWE